MFFNWKDITLIILSFILFFLICYLLCCCGFVIFYFGKKFEINLIKYINNKIGLINEKLKIKKNDKIYELNKDLLIITGCTIAIMILFLVYIIYMNLDLYVEIYNKLGEYIGLNMLLFFLFNVPFYLYILYHTCNYVKIDLSKIVEN
jgi:hypothetical protein